MNTETRKKLAEAMGYEVAYVKNDIVFIYDKHGHPLPYMPEEIAHQLLEVAKWLLESGSWVISHNPKTGKIEIENPIDFDEWYYSDESFESAILQAAEKQLGE